MVLGFGDWRPRALKGSLGGWPDTPGRRSQCTITIPGWEVASLLASPTVVLPVASEVASTEFSQIMILCHPAPCPGADQSAGRRKLGQDRDYGDPMLPAT